MTPGMINKLLSLPGVVSLFIHQPEDNMWCVVADTAHGESIWGVPGDTPQEALDGLARVMGITPSAVHDFPDIHNMSSRELSRRYKEAMDELAKAWGIDRKPSFPTTRNTSAGELRRMHEEAEENT